MKVFSFLLCFIAISNLGYSQNFSQATMLYQQKKYDEAFTIFKTVKKGNPNFAESNYFMGLISMRNNNLSVAEDYLEQAISASGEVAKYHVAMVNVYGQIISKANKLRQATLAPTLRFHMEEAIRLNPNDMNTPLMLVGYYMQAPSFMGGGEDKAIALANSIAKVSKPDGHRIFGIIAHIQKKYPEAEQNYQKALNLSPDSVKYYYSLAQIYQTQSKFDQMVEVYDKAITKFPTNKNLLLNAGRAIANSSEKHWGKGNQYLNTYIKEKDDKSDKSLGDAYYYLGVIAKNKNDNQLAKNHFNSALKINPDHNLAQQALKNLN
jgi:tetratricopeptide (TPR) repeat protein